MKQNRHTFRRILSFILMLTMLPVSMLSSFALADETATMAKWSGWGEPFTYHMNIFVRDAETGDPVPGITFDMYRNNLLSSDYQDRQTTGFNGTATFKKFHYSLEESSFLNTDMRVQFSPLAQFPDDYVPQKTSETTMRFTVSRELAGLPKWAKLLVELAIAGTAAIPVVGECISQGLEYAKEFCKTGVPKAGKMPDFVTLEQRNFDFYQPGEAIYYLKVNLERRKATARFYTDLQGLNLTLINITTGKRYPLYQQTDMDYIQNETGYGATYYAPAELLPTGTYAVDGTGKFQRPTFTFTGDSDVGGGDYAAQATKITACSGMNHLGSKKSGTNTEHNFRLFAELTGDAVVHIHWPAETSAVPAQVPISIIYQNDSVTEGTKYSVNGAGPTEISIDPTGIIRDARCDLQTNFKYSQTFTTTLEDDKVRIDIYIMPGDSFTRNVFKKLYMGADTTGYLDTLAEFTVTRAGTQVGRLTYSADAGGYVYEPRVNGEPLTPNVPYIIEETVRPVLKVRTALSPQLKDVYDTYGKMKTDGQNPKWTFYVDEQGIWRGQSSNRLGEMKYTGFDQDSGTRRYTLDNISDRHDHVTVEAEYVDDEGNVYFLPPEDVGAIDYTVDNRNGTLSEDNDWTDETDTWTDETHTVSAALSAVISDKYKISYKWRLEDEEEEQETEGGFGTGEFNKRYVVTLVLRDKDNDLRFRKWDGVEVFDDSRVAFALTKDNETIPVTYDEETGLFVARDLTDGEWNLKETKAPDGYPKASWTVTVRNGEVQSIGNSNVDVDDDGVYWLKNVPDGGTFAVHIHKKWDDTVPEEDRKPVKVTFIPVLYGTSLNDPNLRYVEGSDAELPEDETITVDVLPGENDRTDVRLNAQYIYFVYENDDGNGFKPSYALYDNNDRGEGITSWQFKSPNDGSTITVGGDEGALIGFKDEPQNRKALYITNAKKFITAKVKWMDHENKDGIRPDSVTVELQKKVTTQAEGEDEPTVSWTTVGEAVEVKDWENEDGVGVGTAKFNAEHEENAEYRVRVTSGTRAEGNEKIITFGSDDSCYKESFEDDTWEPAVVLTAQKRISVEKKWDIDIERLDRPDQITVILQKKPEEKEKSGDDKEKKDWGKPVAMMELSSDNSWKGAFTAERYVSEEKKEDGKTTTAWKGEITYRVRETKIAELKGFLKEKIEAAEDSVIGMLPDWIQGWVKGKADKYLKPEELEEKAYDWVYEKANDTSSALGDFLQDYLKDSVPEDGEYITLSVPSRTSPIRGEIDEHDTMYRVSYKEGDDGTVITNLAAEDVTIWKRWVNIDKKDRPNSVYLMLLSKFDKDYMEMAQAQEIPLVGQYTPVLNPLEGDAIKLFGFIKLPVAIGEATGKKDDDDKAESSDSDESAVSRGSEDGGEKKEDEKPEWMVHFVVKKYGESGIPQDFKGAELVSGAIGEVARAVLGSWASVLEYISLNPFSGFVSASIPAVRVPSLVSMFASFAGLPDLKGLNTVVINTWVGLDPAIGGTKVWKNDEGLEDMRPEEVYIQIYKKAEGEEEKGDKVGTAKATAGNYWTWTYSKDIEKGKEYIIEETADEAGTITEIDGYETEIDGYDVTNTLIATRVKLPIEKKIEGPDREDGDEEKFVFTIKQTDNQGTVEAGNGGEEKKSTPPKIKKDKLEITDEGKGEFTVYFFEPGEYHFTVTEEKGKNEKRYTYDTAARKVTVTVTEDEEDKKKLKAEWTFEVEKDDADDDSGDGTDTASRAGEEKSDILVFTNGYKPAAKVDWKLPVEKKIDGPVREDGDEETFNFTIEVAEDDDSDGTDAQPSGGEASGSDEKDEKEQPRIKDEKLQITDEGKGAFEITFTDAGTYEFTLTEKAGNNKAYSYDMAERTVTVVVEEDKDDAKEPLKVKSWTVKVESDDDNTGDDGQPSGQAEAGGTGEGAEGSEASPGSVVFTNKYKPAPRAAVAIPVVKEIVGPNRISRDKEVFVFNIEGNESGDDEQTGGDDADSDGEDEAEPYRIKAERIEIRDEGQGQFDIKFTQPGTYEFTATEEEGESELYTYDSAEYHITVTVLEDETDTEEPLKATWTCEVEREEDDEQTGALDDEPAEGPDSLTFRNIYHPKGTVTVNLPIEKKVLGPDRTEGEETFTFTIEEKAGSADGSVESGNDEDEKAKPEILEEKLQITGEGKGEFVVNFGKAGTYEFIIAEKEGDKDTYSYDMAERVVTVEVEENEEDGSLTAEWSVAVEADDDADDGAEPDGLMFKNVYQPEGTVTLVIPFEKKIEGAERETRDLETFIFTIEDKTQDPAAAPDIQKEEVRVRDEGQSEFTVNFTKEGTYTFEMAEEEGDSESYTYDTAKRTVTVKVKKNDAGTLEIEDWSAKAEKDSADANADAAADANSGEEDALVFTNKFNPPVDPLDWELPVEKKIDGPERKAAEKETFAFVIEAKAASEGSSEADDSFEITKNKLEITDEGSDKFSVKFTEAGTFEFTVSETAGTAENYTYDETLYTVTVTVEPDGRQLKAEWTAEADGDEDADIDEDAETLVFTNKFAPPPEPVNLTLPVEKQIQGPEREEGDEETFKINLEAAEKYTDADSGEELVVIHGKELEIPDEGEGEFLITFNKAGEYVFHVAEEKGDNERYTYDAGKRVVTVTVEEDGRQLKAAWEAVVRDEDGNEEELKDAENLIFKNTYQPAGSVTVVLPVEKKITGPDREDGEKETFTFNIKAGATGDDVEAPEIQEEQIRIRDEGTGEFTVTLSDVWAYTFTVTEEEGSHDDYTYDKAKWTVSVITGRNDEGDLEATWTAKSEGGEEELTASGDKDKSDNLLFTNKYQPPVKPLTLKLPVEKKVLGPARAEGEEAFTFALDTVKTVIGADGNSAAEIKTDKLQITGDGSDAFEITFGEIGEYAFAVTEEDGGNDLYTYDTAKRTVTVTVTEEDAKLKASVKITAENGDGTEEEADGLIFKNTYQPAGTATLVIPVEKKINGPEREDGEEEAFVFTLEDRTQNADFAPVIAEKQTEITDEGKSEFSVSFAGEGEYTFAVAEKDGGDEAYTYDTTERIVKVKVEKKDDGTPEAVIVEAESDETVFTNIFNPPVKPLVLDIPVEKKITGPDRKAKEKETFTFVIKEKDPDQGETAPADPGYEITKGKLELIDESEGNVTVSFKEIGVYDFEVWEVAGSNNEYTYDSTLYGVKVIVWQDGRELKSYWSATAKDDEGKETTGITDRLLFTNSFHPAPEPLTLTLPLEKIVLGPERSPEDREVFGFVIGAKTPGEGGDSFEIKEKELKITGAGKSRLEATFRAAGEYVFTVAETEGSHDAYTYDTAERTVTVTLTQDGRKLEAETKITVATDDGEEEAEGLVFKNVYQPAGTATLVLPIEKKISGPERYDYEEETFTFNIRAVKTEAAGAAPVIAAEQTRIKDEGKSEFALSFSKPGTYTFTVAEEQGSGEDYTYDTAARTVTVDVTKDDDGKLKTAWTVKTEGEDAEATAAESIVFTNTFNPPVDPAILRLPVEKKILGPDRPVGLPMRFTFDLKTGRNVPKEEPAVQNDRIWLSEEGQTEFVIVFGEDGTYPFTMTEEDGGDPEFIYDTAERRVSVEVAYEGRQLKAAWTVAVEANNWEPEEASVIDFTNIYQPEGTVTVVIPVISYIIGPERPPEDVKVFTYSLDSRGIISREGEETDGETLPDGVIIPDEENPEYNPDEENPEYNPDEEYPEYNPDEEDPGYNPDEEDPGYDPDEEYKYIPEVTDGTIEVADEGSGAFAVVFRAPGVYRLDARQLIAEDENYLFDTDIRDIQVTVVRENGALKATWDYVILPGEDDSASKGGATARGGAASEADARAAISKYTPGKLVFINYYRTPTTVSWSFTKKWSGGVENDIDWKMYNSAGKAVKYNFVRTQVNSTEWLYSTWVDGSDTYYLIEDVPAGYTESYTNTGFNAGVTDRCLDGGTITNTRKSSPTPPWNPPGPGTPTPTPTPSTPVVPHTGDSGQPLLYVLGLLAACMALTGLGVRAKRKKE